MNLFEQLEAIDEFVEKKRIGEAGKILFESSGSSTNAGMGISASSHPFWDQTSPWAMHTDSDFDGIPDALDNHFGPGA
jgi:hypothetical protein